MGGGVNKSFKKRNNMNPEEALVLRLKDLPEKRWKRNEMFNIINEFILGPMLPRLIENNNRLYHIDDFADVNGNILCLRVKYEREKKPGFWEAIKRFFSWYVTGVKISHNGSLFICEYYKHHFFGLCEETKTAYDEKLKAAYGCDFVIVCRAK